MTMPLTITRLYAWVCTDADGSEGIAGSVIPGIDGIMPLIGADMARIESLRPYAQVVADFTGATTVLKVFSGGEVIDRLTPSGAGDER